MRLGATGLLFTVAAASLCGCFAERERLDTPTVDLVLVTREVAAGDSIRGTLEARDASGIVEWVITARSPFDTVRAFGDAAEVGHISTEFGLVVVDTTPPGTMVVVEAVVEDDQNFAIARADTVRITP
jgi:hypothetical protein